MSNTNHHQFVEGTVMEVGKAVPPLAVTGATFYGVTLQDWVLAATLLYTLMQIGHLIYKFVNKRA